MTGSEDDHSNTRPISVAELLARNGTIGAPPIGGRRRRRRGDTDSITVAELTGEIPVIRDDAPAPTNGSVTEETVDEPVETVEGPIEEPVDESVEAVDTVDTDEPVDTAADVEDVEDDEDDDYADAVADYQAHVERRDEDDDLDFFAPPRRSSFARRAGKSAAADSETDSETDEAVDAEHMSPDPLDDRVDEDRIEDGQDDVRIDDDADRDDLPSYLRSPDSPLFGGPTGDGRDLEDDLDFEDEDLDREDAPAGAMSTVLHGALVVGQCVVAVAFGAGLFIAFDQLWKWNSIVALVLGVLVILGLVVGVRVVRKTEDIGSTLIAVAVGAMVTFGPLALIQAG